MEIWLRKEVKERVINCQGKSHLPGGDTCTLLCQMKESFIGGQVRKREKHARQKVK